MSTPNVPDPLDAALSECQRLLVQMAELNRSFEQARSELFLASQSFLQQRARRWLREIPELAALMAADDLVQRTNQRALPKLETFRKTTGSAFRAWLGRILHRVVLNEVRKHRLLEGQEGRMVRLERRAGRRRPRGDSSGNRAPEPIDEKQPSPRSFLIRREREKLFYQALNRLEPRLKEELRSYEQ
jgi:RNA polymerase sigma factor (sigma-70 family)